MRVLVTGGTGAFGSSVAAQLARRGVEVRAMARHEPATLPRGVGFVAGDVSDPDSVLPAVRGCDIVVHLAWTMSGARSLEEIHRVNVGGASNVLHAMEREGARRLVFASSVTAYGSAMNHPARFREDEPLRPDPAFYYAVHKQEVEELIAAADVEAVVVRAATTLGRGVENAVAQQFAGPVILGVRGDTNVWQFVHQEDVGRFLVEAGLGSRTGTVNLGADDVLTPEELAYLLERRCVRLPLPVVRGLVTALFRMGASDLDPAAFDGLRYMPVADTHVLREEWGFRCAWSSADTARDAARSLGRVVYVGRSGMGKPWRLPWVEAPPRDWPRIDGGPLEPAAAPEHAGEFDDRVHPDYATYTATNLSEAFPGPLTPLTVTVSVDALRAGQSFMVDFLGMEGEVAHESRVRMIGVFAHGIYLNVSLARESAKGMPGTTPEDVDHQYLGIPLPEGKRASMGAGEVFEALRLTGRIGPPLAGLGKEADRLSERAAALALEPDRLVALDDAQLAARLALLHDELAQCWAAVIVVNIAAGGAVSALERSRGQEAVAALRAGERGLASGAAVAGVEHLARRARQEPAVAELLRSSEAHDALGALAKTSPGFARAFDDLLADVGHRGPGELELANDVFADEPAMLLEVVAKTVEHGERPERRDAELAESSGPLARIAAATLSTRERIRDTTVRVTHQFRLAARELGRRLADAGVLAQPDDVFFLAYDELSAPPGDSRELVERRRAERARLAGMTVPPMFTGRWDEAAAAPAVETGEGSEIKGIGAAPGVARGPARLVTSGVDLEPGDVLVTRVTDTGWTPFFAFAAAVVTDVGGLMSHPAVVAREHGIPCVVGTGDATARLHEGEQVEVDGDHGIVRVVADAD